MAVYKLFADRDAFINNQYSTGNTGLDEILELGNYQVAGYTYVARPLISFDSSEISDVLDNKVGTATFSSSLKLTYATAYETPTTYSVNAYPVYDAWDEGVGKFGDSPTNTTGVSWDFPLNDSSGSWDFPTGQGITGSNSDVNLQGGSWYTGSNNISLEGTQTFVRDNEPDLDINVTNTVKAWYSGSINNNGFIVKFEDDLEFNDNLHIRHKFFSTDTNTIYPPVLEFKWDDSSYDTGSLNVLDTDQATIKVKNNRGNYINEGKQRFRLTSRPTYPVRTFSTSSIYKVNYALPANSYWALRDEFTEEMVIDFDSEFTKISCDSNGPFFDIYMKGLQPERFYRVLIKSTLDGSTTVIDNGSVFKVVRNG